MFPSFSSSSFVKGKKVRQQINRSNTITENLQFKRGEREEEAWKLPLKP